MMPPALVQIGERIDALAARERLLLLITGLAVCWFLCDTFWLTPVGNELRRAATREQQLQSRQQELLIRQILLTGRETEDPAAALRERMTRIEGEIAELDTQLRAQTLNFVAPRQMTALLTDLIVSSGGLTLTGLRGEPPVSIGGDDTPETGVPVMYRHGLRIELTGDYLALLAWLRRIKALPWQLFWDSLGIEVLEDGSRRFRLRVFTIGLSETWIEPGC